MHKSTWLGVMAMASMLWSGCAAEPVPEPTTAYVATVVTLRGDEPPLVERHLVADGDRAEAIAAGIGARRQAIGSSPCNTVSNGTPPLTLFARAYADHRDGVICFHGLGTARLGDYQRIACDSLFSPQSCAVVGTWDGRVRSYWTRGFGGSFSAGTATEPFAPGQSVGLASLTVSAATRVSLTSSQPTSGVDGGLPQLPCSPLTRSAACGSRECGTVADGCGGSHSCGSCSGGQCSKGMCYPPPVACGPSTCTLGRQCCNVFLGLCATSCL